MTFEEIKRIPDLQIDVTPIVEDAFYFLQAAIKDAANMTDAQTRCGERLLKEYPKNESHKAITTAQKMLDNIEKYGIACAEWA